MSVRAMWKASLLLDETRVPVKLYAAVQDRSVRFRLLERSTRVPVSQHLVDPETEAVVPFDATKRGYGSGDALVTLEPEELEALEPAPSRDVSVVSFVPPGRIDHRWYVRPYYLGPDGDVPTYAAFAHALEASGLEGVARWTMRSKAYLGALRTYRGYPMLVTLRHAEEVVPIEQVERPEGKPLDDRQIAMARQLIGMLEAPFEADAYRDEFRERVEHLIATKRAGEKPEKPARKRKRRPKGDLDDTLRASLQAAARG